MKKKKPFNRLDNPVAAAILKVQIRKDLQVMQTDAMLHALIGENDTKLIDNAARMAFIASEGARRCELPSDSPDMRIVAGMASALADLATGKGDRQLHKLSISSGLQACSRLLEQCSVWAIGLAAMMVDDLINSPNGLTLFDITGHPK